MRARRDKLRIWLRDELKLLHDDINVKDQKNFFDGDDQGPKSKIRLICSPKCTRRGSTFDVSFELPTQLDDALESQAAVSGKVEGPLVKHRQGTTNMPHIEVKSTAVPASETIHRRARSRRSTSRIRRSATTTSHLYPSTPKQCRIRPRRASSSSPTRTPRRSLIPALPAPATMGKGSATGRSARRCRPPTCCCTAATSP